MAEGFSERADLGIPERGPYRNKHRGEHFGRSNCSVEKRTWQVTANRAEVVASHHRIAAVCLSPFRAGAGTRAPVLTLPGPGIHLPAHGPHPALHHRARTGQWFQPRGAGVVPWRLTIEGGNRNHG